MQSVRCLGKFNIQSASTSNSFCRVVIVYDSQTNGALPTWANVFTNYDQALTATTDVKAGINLDFRDRFRIIMDKKITFPGFATATGISAAPIQATATEATIDYWIPLKNLETQYKADSAPAVIGDVASGSLIILTFGDQAATQGFNAAMSVRLRFTDN